jgi:hypothetical protein
MPGRRVYYVLESKPGRRSHKKWGPYYTYEKASEVRDKLVFQAGKYGMNLHFGITNATERGG